MVRRFTPYLVIQKSIVDKPYIRRIIVDIEDVEHVILNLNEDDILFVNYNKRFDEILKFINNIFNILANKHVLHLLTESKIFSFESFDFHETMKLFIIGSVYFSDECYAYTKQSRDKYIINLFELLLRHESLMNECNHFNQSINKLKENKTSIEAELKRNNNQLKKQKGQLVFNNDPTITHTIQESIKQLEFSITQLNELFKELNLKIEESTSEVSVYNIEDLIKPLFNEIHKNLTEIISIKFKNEYRNYDKKTTFMWLDSSLSNHINNHEGLIIPSSFF